MAAPAAYAAAGLPAPAAAQPAPAKGGRLRIGMRVHEIKDPMTVAWVEASNLFRQTHDYLVRTGQDNITRPILAQSWDASPDLRTWTFHIDPAAKWRTGRPFLASDAAWNVKRALDPKTGSSILGLMKSYMLTETPTGETKDGKPVVNSALWDANAIELVDDHTLRLNPLWPEVAGLLEQIVEPGQLTFAQYSHRTAPGPAVEGVVRIGDAWHSASPQLGQGANMALLDAYALALALREEDGVGEAAARAVRLRRRHVWIYQAMSALFTPAYQSDSLVLPVLRDWVVGALNDVGVVGRIQAAMVSGLVGGPLRRLGLQDLERTLVG